LKTRPAPTLPSARRILRKTWGGPRVAILLPPREAFSPAAAGAISLVVQRYAAATSNGIVLGARCAGTFPGIAYHPVTNTFGVIAILRSLRPGILEIHQQPRLALALSYLFPRLKILLFLHNDPLAMRGLKSAAGRRLALARLHRVVCVSDYLKRRYMTGLSGPGPAVLPNPLTLADLPPRAAARAPEILCAGRIVPDKAPDIFIAACAQALPLLPGWSARLIGGDRFGPASPETPYVTQTRAAATAAGVTFTGPLPHAEVLAAMARAAIVVVPSRWPEPFGLTALEALASGAAVITTGQGGLPEITGDAALTVPPDDAAVLAAALLRLARDPAATAALAAAGLACAAAFDTPVIVRHLENLRRSD
jgi:glycosyltransferase involved in cell wall biosynthesis